MRGSELRPRKANLIFKNANVITMDPRCPRAHGVMIGGDRVLALVLDDRVDDQVDPDTTLIDCGGRTIVPGFNDAHCHLLGFMDSLIAVDCRPEIVSTIAALQSAIRQRATSTPTGNWIRATDYDEFRLKERRHPTRWDLDAATTNHPVRLQHRSRHVCVLNSPALALARINRDTADPPGSLIERDETGEPTGVLYEMNAYLSRHVVPHLTTTELDEGFRAVTRAYLQVGVTSVQDATVRNGPGEWGLLRHWMDTGALGLRVDMMIGTDHLPLAVERGLRPGHTEGNLRVSAVKMLVNETTGYLWPAQDDLNEMVLQAHGAGFQVAIHATTEQALASAITAIENALAVSPKEDHRHRIEHCAVCPPELLRRLQQMRVAVVTQPSFLYYSGDRYQTQHTLRDLEWFYRLASFLHSGLLVGGSSDCPIVPNNPFVGIYAAMARRARADDTLLWPKERISAADALWLFTMGGAYASFAEQEKGSLTPGKLADLAVLDADPTELTLEAIPKISVLMTVLGGKVVWTHELAASKLDIISQIGYDRQ